MGRLKGFAWLGFDADFEGARRTAATKTIEAIAAFLAGALADRFV